MNALPLNGIIHCQAYSCNLANTEFKGRVEIRERTARGVRRIYKLVATKGGYRLTKEDALQDALELAQDMVKQSNGVNITITH